MTNPDELLRLAERVEQGDYRSPLIKSLYSALGGGSASLHALDSIDAVEALRRRLLPGSGMALTQHYDGAWEGTLWHSLDCVAPYYPGQAATAPRAFLAALLRAVAGKEGQ